ncbi:hypothetical protein Cob_v007108 [Colletotrichum orbiculare MAFF 240422]|uniref:F-box domain-containing protein n=1 Tax=Colletotrichum orbiculare (strain 104-T / ATCC 96160 / CBS 514.97 / LARS 414 / MAFF 240422) TaxID=1213857 RepID=A0A484FNL3_COLOR|nr:hypothetical protein Cob_v007108 [Colletotrichum orbiculare MAFF 240422]
MRLNDLQLPTEVVSIVLGQSLNVGPDNKSESVLKEARRALFKLRLVCRSWNYIAIRHLFETIQLQYHQKPLQDEDEFGPWSKILGNEYFRNTIHRVVINSTPEDPEMYDSEWSWDEGTGEYPRLTRVIDGIVDLPNLRAVRLSFSDKGFEEWSMMNSGGWADWCESMKDRNRVLSAALRALSQRADRQNVTQVRSLAIKNLPNSTMAGIVSSEAWKKVVTELNEFRLLVTTEYNEHGPDQDESLIERRTFEPHLQKDILPHFTHLTTLTLGFKEPWGSLSGHFDGKGLRFPNIKTLNLISFAIFRYDYLDWVLEQTSLETLRLGACCIISHAMLTEEGLAGLKVSTKDWIQLPSGAYGTEGPKIAYHFPGTWKTEFDRIRTTLTNLVEFRFSGPDRRSFDGHYDHFDNPENIKNDLANGRYVWFHSGACSSPCIIPGDGFGDENPVPTNERGEDDEWGECTYHEYMLEGDSRARNELLETVKKRRSLRGT